MSSVSWLTAFMGDITIALIEDRALFEPKPFDLGNPGLFPGRRGLALCGMALAFRSFRNAIR